MMAVIGRGRYIEYVAFPFCCTSGVIGNAGDGPGKDVMAGVEVGTPLLFEWRPGCAQLTGTCASVYDKLNVCLLCVRVVRGSR